MLSCPPWDILPRIRGKVEINSTVKAPVIQPKGKWISFNDKNGRGIRIGWRFWKFIGVITARGSASDK